MASSRPHQKGVYTIGLANVTHGDIRYLTPLPMHQTQTDTLEPELSMVRLTRGLGWVEIFQFSMGWVGLDPLQQMY